MKTPRHRSCAASWLEHQVLDERIQCSKSMSRAGARPVTSRGDIPRSGGVRAERDDAPVAEPLAGRNGQAGLGREVRVTRPEGPDLPGAHEDGRPGLDRHPLPPARRLQIVRLHVDAVADDVDAGCGGDVQKYRTDDDGDRRSKRKGGGDRKEGRGGGERKARTEGEGIRGETGGRKRGEGRPEKRGGGGGGKRGGVEGDTAR